MSCTIFINYRRYDSTEAVSPIYRDLFGRFGADVFVDTASIKEGDKWEDRIGNSLQEARIVLVIIDDRWLCREKDNPEQLRICSKDDWVRKEIETAISLKKKIIPVLINGTELPGAEVLPGLLKNLPAYQARKLSIRAGDDQEISTFLSSLEETLDNLKSADELKINLKKVLADKYKIQERIAAGTRTNIYLGVDTGIDRKVVIKAIVNQDFKRDFVETLKAAVEINDLVPNSVSILGVYLNTVPSHVIMPYLKRGTLRREIYKDPGKEYSLSKVRNVLLDIGKALSKMHDKGITYCNVKPSNIFANGNGEYYLNPLSLVKELTKTVIDERLNAIVNFPDEIENEEELCYMAPELFDRRENNDEQKNQKIDQFMLGLVGYELMTGRIPIMAASVADLKKSGREAFRPLRHLTEIREDCPNKFSRVIHRMIDFLPDNRYDSLKDAIADLVGISFNCFEIANDSYVRCISAADGGDSFFQTFYHELLKISAEAAKKFEGKGVGESKSVRQYSILRDAIFMLLVFGEKRLGDSEPNVLSRIAQMHNGQNYQVSPNAYTAFSEALVATVCGLSPDIPEAFDSQCKISVHERDIIKDAWLKALKPGIEYMMSKY